jgi:hypothetical protein
MELIMCPRAKIINFRPKGARRSERRCFPRIAEPVRALVRGVDAGGESFEIETLLDNLSAGGLYLRTSRNVARGERLSFIVRLSLAGESKQKVPQIAASGEVVRIEPQTHGLYGLAAIFVDHQFL